MGMERKKKNLGFLEMQKSDKAIFISLRDTVSHIRPHRLRIYARKMKDIHQYTFPRLLRDKIHLQYLLLLLLLGAAGLGNGRIPIRLRLSVKDLASLSQLFDLTPGFPAYSIG